MPFEIHVRADQAATADGVRRLAEIGVTDVGMRFQNTYSTEPDATPLDARIELLQRYSDDVICVVNR
jgi:hypothetical protein